MTISENTETIDQQGERDSTEAPERRLSSDDSSHHAYLLANRERATIALDSWGSYIMQRYGLSAYHVIMEDGRILSPEEAEAMGIAKKAGA